MSSLSSSQPRSHRVRYLLLGAAILWLLLSLFAPAIEQSHGYHAFADQRLWGVLPHAMDVLSNLGFLIAAIWGAWELYLVRYLPVSPTARFMAAVFFLGLACSFAGSSYYHWAPHDASLVWDRLAMCVPFAGIVGLALQQVCDDRSALWGAAAMLVGGIASVLIWQHNGNLLPWSVVQGGGMLALVVLAFLPARADSWHVRLGMVIVFYALAKLFELGDAEVFHFDHELISGHSVKHLLAACAAWPVLQALRRLRANGATADLPFAGTMPVRNQLR